MKRFLSFFIVISLLISFANSQSLAEVAKKERERRKKIKKHVPVITNRTLGKIKKVKGYGYIISSNTGNSVNITQSSAIEEREGDSPSNVYEWWSKKYKELVHKIKVAEDLFNQKKKELDTLVFRFKITNNPNEKFALPNKISKKEKEVAKANEDLKKLKKELEDFKEKARRVGVPPGYLR